MKKGIVLILSIISLILTFLFAELFSIYHFGSALTLLTSLYLISMFSIFEYLSIAITYVVKKLVKKERMKIKQIIGLILLFISLLLILLFLIVINIDWLKWYAYSSPFYLNIIVRSIEFLIPSILFIIVSFVLLKNK